ncbi:FkbM family methyltransferase [Paraburkholderia megapolitana]|uniref:Methyltransferase, FkbM family n=1 Tax=Paraburkholderia megapolitana TaxID=420953 RepID=A0A1I3E5U6_9BURK|nr:FkbM family methyltransferase [Paraburkholderia megapolitana]SFH94367.1 methyltransferase, FkbM family [Paraburkholderia megapolitana]
MNNPPTSPIAPAREPNLVINTAPPYALVRSRHGFMLANRNDIYIGQALIRYGEYGEIETQFLSQMVRDAGVVVEVGANIGSHTVPLAKLAAAAGAEVIAFEPQPFVFQNLCANLALNSIGNVRAWPVACGLEAGTVWFPSQTYTQPGNFGGVSMQSEATSPDLMAVPCVRLDDVLGDRDVSLIKLDVEGFELAALQGACQILKRSRPALYLENDRVEKSQALIEWLWAQEYRLWWHVSPLFNPKNFLGEDENVYRNLSSFNMLALPRESDIVVQGCTEVTDAGHHPLRED